MVFTILKISLFGQTNEKAIDVKINKEIYLNDSATLELTLKNLQSTAMLYLKPDIELIKYGLMTIILKNNDTGEKFLLYLGNSSDIEEIELTCENSVVLSKNDAFIKTLNLDMKNFSPLIKKAGTYSLEMRIDYSIVKFKSRCCQKIVFKKNLNTSIKNIHIK